MEEKKQREKELADRRALVQQKVEMNQRMEKRDKMRRYACFLVCGGEYFSAYMNVYMYVHTKVWMNQRMEKCDEMRRYS